MTQATGDIEIQWLVDLYNSTVRRDVLHRSANQAWHQQFTKHVSLIVIQMQHTVKVLKRSLNTADRH